MYFNWSNIFLLHVFRSCQICNTWIFHKHFQCHAHARLWDLWYPAVSHVTKTSGELRSRRWKAGPQTSRSTATYHELAQPCAACVQCRRKKENYYWHVLRWIGRSCPFICASFEEISGCRASQRFFSGRAVPVVWCEKWLVVDSAWKFGSVHVRLAGTDNHERRRSSSRGNARDLHFGAGTSAMLLAAIMVTVMYSRSCCWSRISDWFSLLKYLHVDVLGIVC